MHLHHRCQMCRTSAIIISFERPAETCAWERELLKLLLLPLVTYLSITGTVNECDCPIYLHIICGFDDHFHAELVVAASSIHGFICRELGLFPSSCSCHWTYATCAWAIEEWYKHMQSKVTESHLLHINTWSPTEQSISYDVVAMPAPVPILVKSFHRYHLQFPKKWPLLSCLQLNSSVDGDPYLRPQHIQFLGVHEVTNQHHTWIRMIAIEAPIVVLMGLFLP